MVSEYKTEENIFSEFAEKLLDFNISGFENYDQIILSLKAGFDFLQAERPRLSINLENPIRLVIASQTEDINEFVCEWKEISSSEIEPVTVQGKYTKMLEDKCLDEIIVVIKEDLEMLKAEKEQSKCEFNKLLKV